MGVLMGVSCSFTDVGYLFYVRNDDQNALFTPAKLGF